MDLVARNILAISKVNANKSGYKMYPLVSNMGTSLDSSGWGRLNW
jgi:hypothetical protein